MFELFQMGGPMLMGILTLLLLAICALAVYSGARISRHNGEPDSETGLKARLSYIKSIGLFALVFGIFGQLLGLYDAFTAIQAAGSVSPAILAGGLKVSMITTLYGMLIFLVSYLLWFGLKLLGSR